MESALELSLEQEFNLTSYKQQIAELDDEQKNQYLVETLRQLMIKNNVIQHLITNGRGASLFSDGAIG